MAAWQVGLDCVVRMEEQRTQIQEVEKGTGWGLGGLRGGLSDRSLETIVYNYTCIRTVYPVKEPFMNFTELFFQY